MPKIRFENGVVVNVEGNPSQQDIEEIASNLGIKKNQENPDATKGVFDAFKKGFSNIKQSISESGKELDDTLSSDAGYFPKIAKTATTLAKGIARPLIAEPVSTLFRAGGEVVQDVTGKDVNEATANAVNKLVQAGMNNDVAQRVISTYQNKIATNPDAKLAGSAIGDVAELLSYVVGGKGAGAVKGAAEATGEAVSPRLASGMAGFAERARSITAAPRETLGVKNVAPEEAMSNVKQRLLTQIEGKSSSIKKLDKTRSDILDTIAKNPEYHPEIDAENKAFNTSRSVSAMNRDIKTYSKNLDDLFVKADQYLKKVKTDDVISEVQRNLIKESNKSGFVVGGEKIFGDIANMLKRMKGAYGETISRKEVWEIRKKIDQGIEKISDTDLKKSLRADTRKAFAKSLEESIPSDQQGLVKEAMGEIGKVIEARDYLGDVLSGSKINGGRLTDLIRNAVAADAGKAFAGVTGFAAGGPVGAVGGWIVSKKIGNWLAKNTLTTAADRKALEGFIRESPDVFDRVKKYINTLDENAKQQFGSNMKRLESPKIMSPGLKEPNIVDHIKRPVPRLPEGKLNVAPGETIRLPEKSESSKLRTFIDKMKSKKASVDNAVDSGFQKVKSYVKKTRPGMSIEDVSQGTKRGFGTGSGRGASKESIRNEAKTKIGNYIKNLKPKFMELDEMDVLDELKKMSDQIKGKQLKEQDLKDIMNDAKSLIDKVLKDRGKKEAAMNAAETKYNNFIEKARKYRYFEEFRKDNKEIGFSKAKEIFILSRKYGVNGKNEDIAVNTKPYGSTETGMTKGSDDFDTSNVSAVVDDLRGVAKEYKQKINKKINDNISVEEVPMEKFIIGKAAKDKRTDNLRKNGIIDAVTVIKEGNRYRPIDGQHRIQVAKEMGRKTIKVIVANSDRNMSIEEIKKTYKNKTSP